MYTSTCMHEAQNTTISQRDTVLNIVSTSILLITYLLQKVDVFLDKLKTVTKEDDQQRELAKITRR